MQDTKAEHLRAADRSLCYPRGTVGLGLLCKQGRDLSLEVYIDSDFTGFVVDRRSTNGYCSFLCGNFIIWKSKKPSIVC